jgi:hypothetical protein
VVENMIENILIQPPRPETKILLQLFNCSSGHPAFEEEGGEISVVLILLVIPNMYRTVSPPEKEEWIQVRNEPEDEVV